MRFVSCLALLAAFLCAHTSVSAASREANLLAIAVIDRDTGSPLPTYSDHNKVYVAGTPGHRYAVRVTNCSSARVLAVLSVDGVNAISGETADTAQTGYVLDAWQSADIAGWRKNLDEIAQFNFTALPNSYAARTGRPDNVGVIGVAVFAERTLPPREPRIAAERADASAAAGAADRAEPEVARPEAAPAPPASIDQGKALARARTTTPLGTGHGERELAHVDTTGFERDSSQPNQILAIRYDSYANLVARGIIARPLATRDPQPFPNHFVADPPRR